MRGLVWFREDLRITDNKALYHAAQQCKAGIVALYIIDAMMWRQHHVAACRVEFVLRGLKELSVDLAKLRIPLIIVSVENTQEIASAIAVQMEKFNAHALFFNRQYEFNERRRDEAIIERMQSAAFSCYQYDDQVILPPTSVTTAQRSYYKIFTPYKHRWLEIFQESAAIELLSAPKAQMDLKIPAGLIPNKISGFTSDIAAELWPAGEKAAQQRLKSFIDHHLYTYNKQRDFPAIDGTSQLSPYLAAGMISPRQCFVAALQANNNKLTTGNSGAMMWMSELIWREFYKHLLIAAPRVSMGHPYQLQTEKLLWNFDEKQWLAWQRGETGYPIIDAAMRQLSTMGWMHNRLRMIVAMFLTKNLFFDWRLGERYFMSHLIDGDLAANNGGWQWSASTGTDAVPYFRIFNPVRQSERFDPRGSFIRRYCPELVALNNKEIHDPTARAPEALKKCHYPKACVDLDETRKKAILAFKRLKARRLY